MAKPRLRLAMVSDAIGPYHHGGKEQRYLELAPRLAKVAEVHLYTMHWWDGPRTMRKDGIVFHAIAPRLPLYTETRRSIWQALVFAICCLRLLFEPFDVLEADHMPYLQLVPLKLIASLRRKPLVVTWHESWGREYWTNYLGPAGQVGWVIERLAMRLPDVIIAASPQTARRLRAMAPNAAVISAPNGIDISAIRRTPAAEPRDIIVVGRLLSHKRVDLLLDAVAVLRTRGVDRRLTVVGSGPELTNLRARAERLGIADLTTFKSGVREHGHVIALLKSARVAVFPTEREGFGIAVLEAIACGVPVVTTSAPDNLARHLVAASGAGIICASSVQALADAIVAAPETIPREAVEETWLAQFDWDAVTAVVRDALEPRSSGRRIATKQVPAVGVEET